MIRFVSANDTLINIDYITHITLEGEKVGIAYTDHNGEGKTVYCDKQNTGIQTFLTAAVL